MEKMNGKSRRAKILEILKKESEPVSGSELAGLTGVSRQVVVQDITLLRTEYPIPQFPLFRWSAAAMAASAKLRESGKERIRNLYKRL